MEIFNSAVKTTYMSAKRSGTWVAVTPPSGGLLMSTLKKLSLTFASSLLVGLAACGGADPSILDFNKGGGNGNGTLAGDKDKNGSGTLGTGSDNKPTPANGDLAACATQSATAEARPVYLVFMFDKSGSMTSNGSPKWGSAKAASKAFFESPDSKGISASLSFFPRSEERRVGKE